jgi:LytR cell envelope-related transcriptional attenuator
VVAFVALREPDGHVTAQRSASSVARQSTSSGATSSAGSTSSSPSTSRTSTSPRSGDSRSGATKSVPLIVLNDTTIGGLASRAAQRFEDGGWTVTRWGNYQNEIVSTCAYYDPDETGAKAAAKALQEQFPTIKRVKKRFPELPPGPVVVVLTPDYSEA